MKRSRRAPATAAVGNGSLVAPNSAATATIQGVGGLKELCGVAGICVTKSAALLPVSVQLPPAPPGFRSTLWSVLVLVELSCGFTTGVPIHVNVVSNGFEPK
jgi:hypothetical protein